jgi:hypothetical protein
MIMVGDVAWQKEDVTSSFRVEENSDDGGRKFHQTLASVCKITLYHIPVTVMFALEVSYHGSKYTLIGFKMKPV